MINSLAQTKSAQLRVPNPILSELQWDLPIFCYIIEGYPFSKIYVTQSEKTGLIAHVSRFDFSPRTHSHMNKLTNSNLKSARLEWSGFAGCFSQAQWRSVRVVWGLNGAVVSLGMTVCGCTALWC